MMGGILKDWKYFAFWAVFWLASVAVARCWFVDPILDRLNVVTRLLEGADDRAIGRKP